MAQMNGKARTSLILNASQNSRAMLQNETGTKDRAGSIHSTAVKGARSRYFR